MQLGPTNTLSKTGGTRINNTSLNKTLAYIDKDMYFGIHSRVINMEVERIPIPPGRSRYGQHFVS